VRVRHHRFAANHNTESRVDKLKTTVW